MNDLQQDNRIDGRALAGRLRDRVGRDVAGMRRDHGITPGLAVIVVGGDPASRTYVRSKRRHAANAGLISFDHDLAETTSEQTLLALIRQLNTDARVHGILVQLPLPAHISSAAVAAAIDPDKDVDGLHVVNTGRLWRGENGLVPCTPRGCQLLLRHARGNGLAGLHAVIIGRSNIVGKPLANLLLREDCTVTLAHSRTLDPAQLCRTADIVVAAAGVPKMVRGDWIKPGASVIDVGINRAGEGRSGKVRLIGDVAYGEVRRVAGAITPVPGGVGPMTIACLLENTVAAACRQHGLALSDARYAAQVIGQRFA